MFDHHPDRAYQHCSSQVPIHDTLVQYVDFEYTKTRWVLEGVGSISTVLHWVKAVVWNAKFYLRLLLSTSLALVDS